MKKLRYIVDDFVPRRFDETVFYLNARAEQGFELVSVVHFQNQYGMCERYFWRIPIEEGT